MDVLFKEKSLVRRDFEDIDSAVKAVENGEVEFYKRNVWEKVFFHFFFLQIWGVVETPGNFSKYFLKRLWSSIDADQETLNKSSINVR